MLVSSSLERDGCDPRASTPLSRALPLPPDARASPDLSTGPPDPEEDARGPFAPLVASRASPAAETARDALLDETYASMNDLRRALKVLSVQKRAPYCMHHSSPQRMEARCPSWRHRRRPVARHESSAAAAVRPVCGFVVSANRHANGRVYVTRAVTAHSSACPVLYGRRGASSAAPGAADTGHAAAVTASALLATALPFMGQLATCRGGRDAVKPKDVSDIMKEKFGVQPSYMTAWRALRAFRKQRKDEDALSYGKLQGYLHAFAETNVGSVVAFEHQKQAQRAPLADAAAKPFARAFLCPQPLQDALRYCRGPMLLSVFLVTSAFGGVVFTATVQDAMGDNVPMAIGLALSETEDEWRFFLEQLQRAFPELKRYVTSIVHNRGDHVSQAIRSVFPSCSQSDKVETFIRSAVPDADTSLMSLSGSPIPLEPSTSTLPLDSSMKWIEALCSKVPLMILVGWVSQVARMLFQRYERYGHLGSEYPADFHSIAAEYESRSLQYDVVRTSEKEFEIIDRQTSVGRVVNFAKQSCTCGEYDVSRFPCLHVFLAVTHAGVRQTDTIPRIFLMTSLKALYTGRITPIDISNVPSDGVTTPQPLPKMRGRPRKVHQIQQSGHQKVEKLSCSVCGIKGHNKRTCKRVTSMPALASHAPDVCEVHTDDVTNAQDETLFLVSSYDDAVAFDSTALGEDGSHAHDRDGRTLASPSGKRRRLTVHVGTEEKKVDEIEEEESSVVALV